MLKLERNQQVLTARLDGDIDHHHVLFLRAALDRVLTDSRASSLVFDLSRVDFMDSSGIGLLIGRYKRMQSSGGQTYICASNPQVDRILSLSGIDTLIRRIEPAAERSAT